MLIEPLTVAGYRREVRGDDVRDVDVVARLAAVAEDRRLAAVGEAAAEDRDHAGLPERVLARPVDVAVAERHRRQREQALVQTEVALG